VREWGSDRKNVSGEYDARLCGCTVRLTSVCGREKSLPGTDI
jgi:hypothetical protein